MSLRNAFLHFLHINVISVVRASWWVSDSAWHSEQSNHCLQHGARMETWAFRMCLLYGPRSAFMPMKDYGDLTTLYVHTGAVRFE